MAVTKETYTALANWTASDAADLFKDAFIDAGYMADWHDSFVQGTYQFRVLKIEHDATKAYGSSFYYFAFRTDECGVSLASGWDTTNDVPTGTQFLDYHLLPSDVGTGISGGFRAHLLSARRNSEGFTLSATSDLFLDRYTSGSDTKQSWFVLRNSANISRPFTILHKDTVLQPWLDLDKGVISGLITVDANVQNRVGMLSFRQQENIRRCLLFGHALRGNVSNPFGNSRFHGIDYNSYVFQGLGSVTGDSFGLNYGNAQGAISCGAITLPVGKNSANPAFATDYVPICTDLPWAVWTPTRLADDFAVYMHYASNTIAHGNKFIVSAGTNEWETLAFANNAAINDGASATFLARTV
jgi:hypothetical protein